MKKLLLAFMAVSLASGMARAQFTSTLTPQTHDQSFSTGREFWYAAQSNYWGEDLGGKYIRIYISSTKNTTAFVEYGGVRTPISITAGKVGSFKVPEFWEMESSGVVESKAIHIYSNDADLTVYNISHNPYTSDGEYLIPTIGWGTDYVVAAYGSLFEGGGSYVYDLPSTMVVVAAQDNTEVTITPSCACRQCTSGNSSGDANSAIVVYPQGEPANFTLNRGQSVEMMPVRASDPENFDMTGTIVHSNVPVGMLGGSVCCNIPANFPYCDHVEDMLPPVRTWGKTYYATNTTQPPGMPGHDFARYLFISSQPGQVIFRDTCGSNDVTECIINNQFGTYWDEIAGAQKFHSADPFMVVQYINGASYPDYQNGTGDPAEAHVNPQEEFIRTVTFQTPQSVGNIVPYENYANIVVNVADAGKTLFDGKHIEGVGAHCLDNNWEVFTMPQIAIGSHTVMGDDSGVGMWIYGIGYDESYAWTTAAFEGTYHSPDSAAPVAVVTGSCFGGHVAISDTGTESSGLAAMRIDSVLNMIYTPDPNWVEGITQPSTFFDYEVRDSSAPAYLLVTAYDFAGNSRAITLTYQPKPISVSSPLLDFGVVAVGQPAETLYDTLTYLGSGSLFIDSIVLLHGNDGFQIDSAVSGPLDSGTIRVIKVSFTSILKSFVQDTIVMGGACFAQLVTLQGSGIAIDWSVDNADWPAVPFQTVAITQPITVHNNSPAAAIHITSAVADSTEFMVDASSFPLAVPESGTAQFNVSFTPLYPGQNISSVLHVQSTEAAERTATLTAEVKDTTTALGGVTISAATSSATVFTPNGTNIIATVPTAWPPPVHIEIEDLLGQTVFQKTLTIEASASIDPGPLSRGVYFYRVTAGSMSQSGKILLGQ